MGKKHAQRRTISEQIRRLIESSGMSRYEISMRTGIEQSALSRFMSGKRGLTTATLDRLGELFDLDVVQRGRKGS